MARLQISLFLPILLATLAVGERFLNSHTCQQVRQTTLVCSWEPDTYTYTADSNPGVSRLVFERFWRPSTLDVANMIDLTRVEIQNGEDEMCEEVKKRRNVALFINGRRCPTQLTTDHDHYHLSSHDAGTSSKTHPDTSTMEQPTTVQLTIETSEETVKSRMKVTGIQQTTINVHIGTNQPTSSTLATDFIIGWKNLGLGLQAFIIGSVVLLLITLFLFIGWLVRGTQCRLRRSACNKLCCSAWEEERVVYSRRMELSDF